MAGNGFAVETPGSGSGNSRVIKALEVLLYLAGFLVLIRAPWFSDHSMTYFRGTITLIYKYELLRLIWMPIIAMLGFIVTVKGVFEKEANALKYKVTKIVLLSFSVIMTAGVQLTLFKSAVCSKTEWGGILFTVILAVLLVMAIATRVDAGVSESVHQRFSGAFCYLFALPGAVITMFLNNDDETLLKHAVQSLLYSAVVIGTWFVEPLLGKALPAGLAVFCVGALIRPRFVLTDVKGVNRLFKWVQPQYINIVNLVGGILCLVGAFFILDSIFAFTRYEAISTAEGEVDPFRYDLTRNIVFFVLNTGVGLFLIWDNSRQSPDGETVV